MLVLGWEIFKNQPTNHLAAVLNGAGDSEGATVHSILSELPSMLSEGSAPLEVSSRR